MIALVNSITEYRLGGNCRLLSANETIRLFKFNDGVLNTRNVDSYQIVIWYNLRTMRVHHRLPYKSVNVETVVDIYVSQWQCKFSKYFIVINMNIILGIRSSQFFHYQLDLL